MKFTLTFKTPDVTDQFPYAEEPKDSKDVFDECNNCVRPYLKFNEYLSVEFDTDTGTATVLKIK
jgi:hypothetical protein